MRRDVVRRGGCRRVAVRRGATLHSAARYDAGGRTRGGAVARRFCPWSHGWDGGAVVPPGVVWPRLLSRYYCIVGSLGFKVVGFEVV